MISRALASAFILVLGIVVLSEGTEARESGRASAPAINCNSEPTDAARTACEARELENLKEAHLRLYEACEKTLPEDLRSELAAQERGWRANLESECTGTPCITASIRSRDVAIRTSFPQCGPVDGSTPLTTRDARSLKTGMLPARWTPPQGLAEPVPFSFEAQSATKGTLSATLGRGGEQFHGSYVRVEKSTRGHLVTEIYDGWSSPEWETWQHGPDGQWTATGVSFGDFARFYTGKVVATLAGNRGSSMRCQLTVKDPASGLGGGGSGTCQVSNGGRVTLAF